MSSFPANRRELLRASYRQTSANAICKGCQASIEWWKTNNGKPIPMNPMADDYTPAVAHWATCPHARDFRGGDTTQTPAKGVGRLPSVDQELHALCVRHKARVVVLIDEFGPTAIWKDGIPAEDLRHDLISAGNFVRAEVSKKEGTPA